MKNNQNKKVLNLKKETLVRLQEKQMRALVGAEEMSNKSGVCGNTIEVPIGTLGLAAAGDSCCKRSCNGK
ncbi:class I lanthipeptide [Chryseobacterium sp. NRRL B-14859]|uniref:class I lanthipeptide n=1 Tax=Chryseobacterium sp. NRRL B-14859 TaxID=1562763 RepID=UPI00339091EF